MPQTPFVPRSVFADENRMASEGTRFFNLNKRIAGNPKYPASSPVDEGEDDSDEHMRSADKAERVSVNAVARKSRNGAGERPSEEDDVKIESFDSLIRYQ
jgi:hypothetical protein